MPRFETPPDGGVCAYRLATYDRPGKATCLPPPACGTLGPFRSGTEPSMRPFAAVLSAPMSNARRPTTIWSITLWAIVMLVVSGVPSMRALSHRPVERPTDVRPIPLEVRLHVYERPSAAPNVERLEILQTPYGAVLGLSGLACITKTAPTASVNTVDQDDGPGRVATVHDAQPPMVCPTV